MQDYKSLCAAAAICGTLVNIQTHRETDSILTSLCDVAQRAEPKTLQNMPSAKIHTIRSIYVAEKS